MEEADTGAQLSDLSQDPLPLQGRPADCWIGALRVLHRWLGLPALALPQAFSQRETESGPYDDRSVPLFAERDPAALDTDVAAAFKRFVKFQTDFGEQRGISIVGLKELCAQLAMDISEVELERLFEEADIDSDAWLSLAEFHSAAQILPFFSNLVLVMTAPSGFRVGREYDYASSTYDNYKCMEEASSDDKIALPRIPTQQGTEFNGHFDEEVANARKVFAADIGDLDYSQRRIMWQNSMVLRASRCVDAQASPWLIFTLAEPGALPGKVLTWLASKEFFTLRQVVKISANDFVQFMPELPLYVRRHGYTEARMLVLDEAELLESVAREVAMVRRQHVWVSCSPAEASRIRMALETLRSRHVTYRVAVLDVRADSSAILRRHRSIVRESGRGIMEAPQLPREVDLSALAAMCDFVAQIENSENQPILKRLVTADTKGCWEAIASRLSGSIPTGLTIFPQVLPPLRFERVQISEECFEKALVAMTPVSDNVPCTWLLDMKIFGPAMGWCSTSDRLAAVLGANNDGRVRVRVSKAHPVLPGGSEADLVDDGKIGVETSEKRAWLYGLCLVDGEEDLLSTASLQRLGVDPTNVVARVLTRGGFMHLSAKGRPMFLDVPTDSESTMYVQFGHPKVLPPGAVEALAAEERWEPVADLRLRVAGAQKVAWLAPGEELAGHAFPRGGAFAYCFCCGVDAAAKGRMHVYYSVLD